MTPADLRAVLDLLTGDVTGVASSIGYSRQSMYDMLHGRMRVSAETEARLLSLLDERRSSIETAIAHLSPP